MFRCARSVAIAALALAPLVVVACGSSSKGASTTTTISMSSDGPQGSSNTTSTTAPPTTASPSSMLVGNWYGPQADDFATTCPGSTTYTFTANGQFTTSTIYSPSSTCANTSASGTWTFTGNVLKVTVRANSPVGNTFSNTLNFSFVDSNTFMLDGRLYHRS